MTSRLTSRKRLRLVAVLLAAIGVVFVIQGGWIQAKAALAQILLQGAWAETVQDGKAHRPWPWADFWPVARLKVPNQNIDLIVLEGDSGNVLAFGPGHNPRSGRPFSDDTIVISGHRDTHFRFLQDLRRSDLLVIQTARGEFRYRVDDTEIVDSKTTRLQVTNGDRRVLLTTCYPFDTLVTGGPLRYLVSAKRII